MSMTYEKEKRMTWTIPDSTGDNHWFDIADVGEGCKFLYGMVITSGDTQVSHGMVLVKSY